MHDNAAAAFGCLTATQDVQRDDRRVRGCRAQEWQDGRERGGESEAALPSPRLFRTRPPCASLAHQPASSLAAAGWPSQQAPPPAWPCEPQAFSTDSMLGGIMWIGSGYAMPNLKGYSEVGCQ